MIYVQVKYAPLIHARTKLVDFRSGFLVKPENFSDSDVNWANALVLDSTRFFELGGEHGRRVVFSNGRFVVSGITILIQNLFQKCGRAPEYHRVDESQQRLAYGFIGIVLPVSAAQKPFDIPYEVFLNLYLQYVVPRWDETTHDAGVHEATRAGYMEGDFPTPESVADLDTLLSKVDKKLILDDVFAEREGIAAYILSKALCEKKIAFCSDISLSKAIIESGFDIVTCKNADLMVLNGEQKIRPSKPHGESSEKAPAFRPARPAAENYDEQLSKYSAVPDGRNSSHSEYNRLQNMKQKVSEHLKEQARIKNSKPSKPDYSKKPDTSVLSYEEQINQLSAPVERIETGSPYGTRQKQDTTQTDTSLMDTIAGIGIGTGVVVTVIGLATEANPVVLCATGLFTVALTGIEAKRIIDRINNK